MKIISQQQIKSLNIPAADCVKWVCDSFLMKRDVQLPAKISLHPQGNDFFNTMPCVLPAPHNLFSVKIVHRISNATPSLGSDLLLYNSATGELLAMMDADWITTMRTGAVATLAAQTFRVNDDCIYGFLGLGNTGRATMLCLLESEPDKNHRVILLRHKDQAESFMDRFRNYDNVEFSVSNSVEEIVSVSDVVVSCITNTNELLCPDDSLFKEGCLIIPVHTKGFQNCDLFFDKVFGDDTGHLHGFRYFDKFRKYAEISDVLRGEKPGRETTKERILSYNIGIGLHDAVFAKRIYDKLKDKSQDIAVNHETDKFWI
ncbi:MAG: ornithine cyclodeaminase [Bacteroidales bacterium]|nr:ornithine cyclodeaminase [Bacteroidales bacterium]